MRGFVGPIGDDLPSVIAIMLALGLFFSGVAYSLESYNLKMDSMRLLQGSLETSRALTASILLPQDLRSMDDVQLVEGAKRTAITYGLDFEVSYGTPNAACKPDSYVLRFFVARQATSGVDTATLVICFWRAV